VATRLQPYSEKTILELVDGIYTAAADSSQWQMFLERLGRVLGATAGAVHHQHFQSQEGSLSEMWNLDPSFIEPYVNYYCYRNVWFTNSPELIQQGGVNVGTMLCPEPVLLRSEYYNEWLLPQNVHHLLAITIPGTDSVSSNLSILKPKSAPPFGEHDCALMQALMPHMQRAFQLHNRIQNLESRGACAAQALDSLPTGVIFLDGKGGIVLVNRTAQAILRRTGGLKLTSHGVEAGFAQENAKLKTMVQGALATGNGRIAHSGGVMAVSKPGSSRPLYLLVAPLRLKSVQLDKAAPVAAIFITDPELEPRMNARHFEELYGLTPAEAKLAKALAAGQSLSEAAEELSVGQSTLRSHLKSIFVKTQTKRQSELVRLLMLGPARLLVETPAPEKHP